MTDNTTATPLVSDEQIINSVYQLTYRVVDAIALQEMRAMMYKLRDQYEAKLREVEAQAQAQATVAGEAWLPLEDGEYIMQSGGDHTYTLHVCFDGAELEAWSNADEDKYKDGTPKLVQEVGIGEYRLFRRTTAADATWQPAAGFLYEYPDGKRGLVYTSSDAYGRAQLRYVVDTGDECREAIIVLPDHLRVYERTAAIGAAQGQTGEPHAR